MAEAIRWIGLQENKVAETLKNVQLTNLLIEIVEIAKRYLPNNETAIDKQKGNFLYQLATKLKPQCRKFLPLIVERIVDGRIRNDAQFTAALVYLLEMSAVKTIETIDCLDFHQKCGIGVVVSIEEIENKVAEVIAKHKNALIEKRYAFNIGKLLGDVRQVLQWADGALVKREVDLRVSLLLGPKTESDLNPSKAKNKVTEADKPKKVEKNKQPESKSSVIAEEEVESIEDLLKNYAQIHKVGENYKTDGYVVTPNTMKLLANHVKAVDGKPNGVLHIGHAKAININFGLAKALGGKCILRYDDTNPEKEEEKFFNVIKDMVEWLGYTPWKITHSSDYFNQLYEWAVKLIEKGHAYVCHQSVDEMRGFDVKPSLWRERPIEESLKLFNQMKNGLFGENEATLRLKVKLEEGKIDPVAYRIKFIPHHRTKDKWCIYPTYDYTHCLCDSIENVTHSLCTKEFQSRRSSYYWLCNALDIYCPVQWEYSRLNMENVMLSKRKILKLIETGVVSDWDDPRLFTLTGLRRRGIPAEAINKFVAKLGLTVAQTLIQPSLLDSVVRDYLNVHAPRTMAVLEPLCIKIVNYNELGYPENHVIDAPLFPTEVATKPTSNTDDAIQNNLIAVSNIIFIEFNDFRESEEKGFRRLTKLQVVGLKHVGLVLQFVGLKKNKKGELIEVSVKATKATESEVKPKAFIHWVSKPVKCDVHTYEQLENNVQEENSEEHCIAPLKIFKNALIDNCLMQKKKSYYQFERIGFFGIDAKSSNDKKLVFNQIVALKDTSKKS